MTISEFKATLAADEINEFEDMGAEYAALLFGLERDDLVMVDAVDVEQSIIDESEAALIAEDWTSVVDDED